MYDIITIGDCANDVFLKPHEASVSRSQSCPHMGKRNGCTPLLCLNFGEKIVVDEVHYDIGGSACNVAVGTSRLGNNTAIFGSIGEDLAGERVIARLESENISQNYLKKYKNSETSFSTIITYKGERTILVYHGLKDYAKLKLPHSIKAKWLYISPLGNGYQNIYKKTIAIASERNVKVVINPGIIQIKGQDSSFKSLLRVTEILFVNREEALELIKAPGFLKEKELLQKVSNLGPKIVVITDGKNGAYATDGQLFLGIKSLNIESIDSTGAGDAFSSGFLSAYLQQKELDDCLKWGIINSVSVIEKIGAQTGLLNLENLHKDLKAAPGIYRF